MGLVKFGDYVKEVKINIDRNNNPYEYYVAGDHMDSEDLTIRRKGLFATDDVGPAFTRLFKTGQILYGSRRTYLKKVAVADFEGICSNTTFVLETKDENKLRQRLLPFIMLTDDFTKWSISKSKGSTNPYILFSDLANYEFELPDINKQDELVKLLWQAYATKESYREMIRATDEMVKSQFIEMFGVAPNHNHRISDYLNLKAGKNISAEEIQSSNNGTLYPCFGGNGLRGYVKDYTHDGNYVLIGRQGALCGNVQRAEGKFFATEHAVVVSPKIDIDLIWLYHALLAINLKHYAKGVAQPGLAVNQLEQISFIVPDINQQKSFSSIANQADKSKFELKQAIEKIDKVMRALMQ